MDEKYFNWLYEKIRPMDNDQLLPYTMVCTLAHRIIFDWSVPNDDNRAAEGKELRYEFEEELGIPRPRDTEWMGLDASVLEMMVALARRCDFIVELGVPGWFDLFMHNLVFQRYSDACWSDMSEDHVSRALRKVNLRTYSRTGQGGLFPLKKTPNDQRKVELWYQMSEYMAENKMY